MDDDNRSWEERCDRYFSSISDTEKDRGQEKNQSRAHTGTGFGNEKYCQECAHDGVDKGPWSNLSELKRPVTGNTFVRRLHSVMERVDLNGTRLCAKTRSSPEVAFWSILIVCSVAVTGFLFYLIAVNYVNAGYAFKLKRFDSNNDKTNRFNMVVSICNENLLKKNALKGVNSGSFLSALVNTSSATLTSKLLTKSVKLVLRENGNFENELNNESFINELEADIVVQEMRNAHGAALVQTLASYGLSEVIRALGGITSSDVGLYGHAAADSLLDCWVGNRKCGPRFVNFWKQHLD